MKKFLTALMFLIAGQCSLGMEHIVNPKKRKRCDENVTAGTDDITQSVNKKIAAYFENKTPHFASFDDVKNHLINNARTHRVVGSRKVCVYICAYDNCTFYREKNVHEVASCFLSHYQDNFFECPYCNKNFTKINGLKNHVKTTCKKIQSVITAQESRVDIQNILPRYMLTLPNQSTSLAAAAPHLVSQTQSSQPQPITQCLANSSDFLYAGVIENTIEEFTTSIS